MTNEVAKEDEEKRPSETSVNSLGQQRDGSMNAPPPQQSRKDSAEVEIEEEASGSGLENEAFDTSHTSSCLQSRLRTNNCGGVLVYKEQHAHQESSHKNGCSSQQQQSSPPHNDRTPTHMKSIVAQTSTEESCTDQDLCRICQIGETDSSENPLINPCKCSGSVRYVHQSCLQKWIKSSDIKCCELCRYEFKMQTKLKPFSKWEKLDMSTSERRKILCSIGFHLVAITCVIWSLYVLIQRTAQEVQQKEFHWPFWTKLIVVAIGFIGGLVFMYVQCKVYVQLWRRLKAYNRVIYVQNNPLTANTTNSTSPTHPHLVPPQQQVPPITTSQHSFNMYQRSHSNQDTSCCEITTDVGGGGNLCSAASQVQQQPQLLFFNNQMSTNSFSPSQHPNGGYSANPPDPTAPSPFAQNQSNPMFHIHDNQSKCPTSKTNTVDAESSSNPKIASTVDDFSSTTINHNSTTACSFSSPHSLISPKTNDAEIKDHRYSLSNVVGPTCSTGEDLGQKEPCLYRAKNSTSIADVCITVESNIPANGIKSSCSISHDSDQLFDARGRNDSQPLSECYNEVETTHSDV